MFETKREDAPKRAPTAPNSLLRKNIKKKERNTLFLLSGKRHEKLERKKSWWMPVHSNKARSCKRDNGKNSLIIKKGQK